MYIEPHAHMVSRTTDDYQAMLAAGCVAVCEPAFWAGFDRGSPDGFRDYFRQLTEYEPRRAAKFGLAHYCWLCINPKEAEDAGFAREVMALIPEFVDAPTVLGIGEIGLNKNTRNELAIFEEHVDLAIRHDLPILIHTPHLEDKLKGSLEPWLCYYCGECSEECPRGAEPGETMMSLRRWLTAKYDFSGISRLFYRSGKIELLAVIGAAKRFFMWRRGRPAKVDWIGGLLTSPIYASQRQLAARVALPETGALTFALFGAEVRVGRAGALSVTVARVPDGEPVEDLGRYDLVPGAAVLVRSGPPATEMHSSSARWS